MRVRRAIYHLYIAVVSLALLGFSGSFGPALTDAARVIVETSGAMGTFGGREYYWAIGAMEGTVDRNDGTSGRYRVPVSLMYPDSDPNGFGFVDLVNSADFELYAEEDAPFGRRKIYYPGDMIFSDYLRREGFVYMSVQWSRMVTEILGGDYGMIENGEDATEIIKDAVRFLRDPNKIEGNFVLLLGAVDHVVGYGHSQTGALLLEFFRSGQNREADGALVFDGGLAGVHIGCLIPTNEKQTRSGLSPFVPFEKRVYCDGPPPDDGKLIALQSETDVENLRSDLTRFKTDNFRQYELAGIAHIPTDMIGLKTMGADRQNPVSFKPAFKAMLRNLVDWIATDTPPPAPRYIEGQVDANGDMHIVRDSDGNAKGGVRLPHMPVVLPNGERAGAPLGVYTGLDLDYEDPLNVFPLIGGTFEPFSEEELSARYPSREAYAARVEKAAAALLAERFILPEDYEAYVRAAERGR